MLSKMIIKLQGDPAQKHGAYISSMLQGAMIELIDEEYAEQLHCNRMHP